MLNLLSLKPRPRTPVLSLAATLSPRELDWVKLVALLAMLGDHINTLFLSPSRPELYALGRMAFPLFTLMWAVNLNRPGRSLQARANRCWLWAVVLALCAALYFHPGLVRYRQWLTGGLCVSLLTLNGLSMLPQWPLATLVMAVLPTVMLPSCVLTAVTGQSPDGRRFMPRSFFWWAYAGHLLLLGLVRLAL